MSAGSDRRRVAVVLFNLGGPDSLKAIRPFLYNLFTDPAIINLPPVARHGVAAAIAASRVKMNRANYGEIGGASPLLRETEAQRSALQAELAARLPDVDVQLFIAMRYWRPFTDEAAAAVAAFAPDDVVLLPLYPQYSSTTTGSSFEAWRRAYKGPGVVRAVCCYPEEPGFIEAHARRIEATFEAAGRPSGVRLLLSAHGLPQKVVDAGDPYQSHVERTCRAVAARLGQDWDWQVCFQSRVGPMKWLGPYTTDAIAEAAEQGLGVLIAPIAFVSEHVETLIELDRDYGRLAEAAGCPIYLRAPALGVEPNFIGGLADITVRALGRDGLAPAGRACDGDWARCPYLTGRAA